MSHSSTPLTFPPSETTGVVPMPVVQPLYPGLPSGDEGIRMLPLPGVRCPTCAANGQEVWVIPGRACGNCGTPCC
ncbi:hypothetical protein NKR19_g9016 [Coniochaeta hoffmannii]|uniref:Uncharacterized protein n=1 Tax=Coniochaeta hoffmannii TaxID=91930 RepID=A0AA38VHS0_9PEZI|nr:hypothetical protein NKR19_g9016 [Coniochaeta hoffmannii]